MTAPKKIGQEKKEKSKRKFLIGCAGSFIVLFIVFIVLMVLMISRSGASNAVMKAFGLDPGALRSFLQLVVGLSFGIISLLFFVLAVIGLFKYLGAQKTDKETKSRNIKLTLISTFMLILVVFIWFTLSNFIGKIEIAAERVIAEIVVLEPEDLTGVQAPVEIKLSALNVARALEYSNIAIQQMSWDLDGDGFFETPVDQPEVTHLYSRQGNYNVGLEVVVVGEEESRIYNKLIVIEGAVFDAQPSTGTAPLEVQFDAGIIVNKSDVMSLDWDFDGDGLYELEGPDNLRPRYTFDKIGTYSVHLRVLDKQNNVENYYRDIEITPSDVPLLSARIDASPGLVGPIPLQIRFDGSQSKSLKGTILKYEWDFGDGSDIQSGKSVSHVYRDSGFYTISLSIEDSLGNEAQTSVEVEAEGVSSAPEAMIETIPVPEEGAENLVGILPFKVEFDASGSTDPDDDIVDYQWDFDSDGTIDEEGQKVTHTFDEIGTFTVSLAIKDTEDQSSLATLTVVVNEPGVQAVFTADPEEGTAPLTVQFDGSSSSTYEGNIVSYEWDFGDGSPRTITGASVSHKYNEVGTYIVSLKVLTNQNESAGTTKQIYVREIPLRACFTPSRKSGEAPLTVTFDAKCSTGAVSAYSWSFGDGEDSDVRKPNHTYEFPGNYTVTLEVSDEKNNVDTYQDVIVAEGELQ